MSTEIKVDGEKGPLTVHALRAAVTGELKCYYCKRKMRARGVKKHEAPDTISMHNATTCSSCYKKEKDKREVEKENAKRRNVAYVRRAYGANPYQYNYKPRKENKPLYLKPEEEIDDLEVRRNLTGLKKFIERRKEREEKRARLKRILNS